jgi:hypothetical protein
MADVNNVISMLNIIKQTERAQVIREIEALQAITTIMLMGVMWYC